MDAAAPSPEMYGSAASGGLSAGIVAGIWVFYLLMAVLMIVAYWKIYSKAGQPGWAALIPIYNVYILLKVVGRSGWWLLLFLVPFVQIIAMIIVDIDLAKSFGRGIGFALGLIFLPFIWLLLLAFGSDTYKGPAAAPAAPAAPQTPPAQTPTA